MMPVLAYSPQKRAYSNKDTNDWVRHWNAINTQNGSPDKEIAFRFTDKFPIRSPELLRVAMVEPRSIPLICKFLKSILKEHM